MAKSQPDPTTPAASTSAGLPYPHPVYAWYVVVVLLITYTNSFIDRQILSLLVEPLKRDLQITDTQVSLLQGMAFALFYTLMGLPIGRIVDTRRRFTIITVGLLFWTTMTTACGFARTYWQLFLFRMGIGAGEAALSPAAYSLISDYFPPKRTGIALGVYGMGVYLGLGLALVIGAEVIALIQDRSTITVPVLGELYVWQMAFLIVGLPGLPLALWLSTLREPIRRDHTGGAATNAQPALREVLAYFGRNWRTLTCQNIAYAFSVMMSYGLAAWVPTFMLRTHDWSYVEAGRAYGWIIVICGTTGVVVGGYLSDRLSERFRAGRILAMMIAAVLTAPFAFIYPLTDNITLMLVCLAATTFLSTFSTGAGPAALQEIMPNQMRGIASALMIFVITLIGLGLGPTTVALVTDYVFADPAMLRYSLAYVAPATLGLSFVIAWAGLKPYARTRDELSTPAS